MTTNNNLSGSVLTTSGNTTFTTISSNTQYTNISPNLYSFSPTYQPSTFSVTFSWDGREVNVSLKTGDDVFKLANAFMEWLDKNDIEYNVKTKGRKKKK